MVFITRISLVRPTSSLIVGDHSREMRNLRGKTLITAVNYTTLCIPYRDRFLFFRQPKSGATFKDTVLQMKESVATALVHFYPIAGRISLREDGRMDLDCNDAGIGFSEARSNLTLGEEEQFDLDTDILEQLSQAPGYENRLKWPWPAEAPLLFIQVTEFDCGGICVGLKYNHQLLDGTSFWHFIKSWAETSRGVAISLPPEILPDPNASSSSPPPKVAPTNQITMLTSKRIRFGKANIQAFKKQHQGLTTFQLLTSYIWREVTRARHLADHETTQLTFPINCRQRIPFLSAAYLGCAFRFGKSVTTAGLLKAMTLPEIASLIKKTIKNLEQGSLTLNDSETKTNSATDLVVGSSFNFPAYQEFAWGSPFELAMVQARAEGRVYYFPGQKQGSIDVYITLHSDVMQRLELDSLTSVI